jgi:hypothetical protein
VIAETTQNRSKFIFAAAVLADQPIDPNQKPSIGCNIKWKAGNEPSY